MKLVLHYRGPLRSNGDPLHKQQIRQCFSEQLRRVWAQEPLAELKKYLEPRSTGYCFLRDVAGVQFIPLVTAEANTVAELRVVMLRPGAPGDLLSQGGDIDNRLKTLFDALSMPQANQISGLPDRPSSPMFCLLEDDRLVTQVEVRAEQLLEEVEPSWVDLTVAVRTRVTRQSMGNFAFA